MFYCDDCRYFICKQCFANSHRNHNSNLPNIIGQKFVENLHEFLSSVSAIKPKIDESLEDLKSVNAQFKNFREISIKRLKEISIKINSVCKQKFDHLLKEFSKLFMDIDSEIENVWSRLLGLQKKISKALLDYREFQTFFNNNSNPVEICAFKKLKKKNFQEIVSILEDSKNLINFKVPLIKIEAKEKMEVIKASIQAFYKKIKIIEKSIENSISSGITNNSIILRRFIKYNRKGLSYYKSSSLFFHTEAPVFLTGLGLCGLYISSAKYLDKNIIENMSSRRSIQINITVSEFNNNYSSENKISETHSLCGIVNKYDPTFTIYFKKIIHVKALTNYIITITNVESNSYIDLWMGEVNKVYSDSMNQIITCNQSNIKFHFKPSEGIESDFNEFNMGIISNLIYSKIE